MGMALYLFFWLAALGAFMPLVYEVGFEFIARLIEWWPSLRGEGQGVIVAAALGVTGIAAQIHFEHKKNRRIQVEALVVRMRPLAHAIRKAMRSTEYDLRDFIDTVLRNPGFQSVIIKGNHNLTSKFDDLIESLDAISSEEIESKADQLPIYYGRVSIYFDIARSECVRFAKILSDLAEDKPHSTTFGTIEIGAYKAEEIAIGELTTIQDVCPIFERSFSIISKCDEIIGTLVMKEDTMILDHLHVTREF